MPDKNQQQCFRCIMDKSAEEIVFENGVCNFCHQAQKSLKEIAAEKYNLSQIIQQIKNSRCQCDD